MFSLIEGSSNSQRNKDLVYKENYRGNHEFFKLYDETMLEMGSLKNQTQVVVYDKLSKNLKTYKRLVCYYFFYIINKLQQDPKFREAADSLLPEINQFISVFDFEKIPGMMSKCAKLPGHITHYYQYINDWLDVYKPITITKTPKTTKKENLSADDISFQQNHINFIN